MTKKTQKDTDFLCDRQHSKLICIEILRTTHAEKTIYSHKMCAELMCGVFHANTVPCGYLTQQGLCILFL